VDGELLHVGAVEIPAAKIEPGLLQITKAALGLMLPVKFVDD
jgi:hypothetical protein